MALFLLVFHPCSALTDRVVNKWMIHQRAVIIDHFFEKNYSFAICFSWRKSLNNSINPNPQALLLQATSSDDIIEISIRISKAKVLRVYSLWKKRVARSLVFSLCLVVPNCIHIESPSFTYTKNETHIYHNVIPHTDR